MTRRLPVPRLLRAALLLACLVIAAELVVGWAHFQRSPERGSALLWLGDRMIDRARRELRDRELRALFGPVSVAAFERAVFTPAGAAVLAELQAGYGAEFAALLARVRSRGGTLVLFYVPSDGFSRGEGEQFFAGLAARHDVPFVAASRLAEIPAELAFLAPWDTHPSRLGHRLMAEALAPVLERLGAERAPPPAAPAGRGSRLGDFPPGMNEIMRTQPLAPYVLRTNHQGLRMDRDVPPAPAEQVVLLLGDSFTFGTPLPVEDVYAIQLARLLPDRLFVNAGVGGYGIREERALYEEHWGAARADIVVLQVVDNDLTGLLWYGAALWTRAMPSRSPTEAERDLLSRLQDAASGNIRR